MRFLRAGLRTRGSLRGKLSIERETLGRDGGPLRARGLYLANILVRCRVLYPPIAPGPLPYSRHFGDLGVWSGLSFRA